MLPTTTMLMNLWYINKLLHEIKIHSLFFIIESQINIGKNKQEIPVETAKKNFSNSSSIYFFLSPTTSCAVVSWDADAKRVLKLQNRVMGEPRKRLRFVRRKKKKKIHLRLHLVYAYTIEPANKVVIFLIHFLLKKKKIPRML